MKRVKYSKAERQQEIDSIVSAITAIGVDFGVFQELSSDKIVLELADMGDKQRVMKLIPPKLRSVIKVRKGFKVKKTGGIYAGNWYKKGALGSALCTMGWAVRNSRGQEGVMTAGHCQPRDPYFPYVDGGTGLGAPYSYRDTVANGKTYDFAIYNLGTNYSGPYVYVDNNVAYNGKTNSVPGFGDGYYSVVGVRKYYSQLNGLMVCKNGARTGFTCGQIETNNYTGNGYYRLVKVSNSSQPYIAVAGDSGAPAFAYPNGSQVNATGIVVAANEVSGNACDNTQNAGQCAFFYMPLSYAAEQEPYTVNTTAGFVTP